MPPSSVAARSLALALIGVGAASFAAHGQNVVAFNPYSGAGLPGGQIPQSAPQTAQPVVDAVGPGPAAGPAFNPWSSRGQAPVARLAGASAAPNTGPAMAGPATAAPPVRAYDPGASLPPPPSGRIASRIVAVPELTTKARSRNAQKANATTVAPKPKQVAVLASGAAPAPVLPPTRIAKAAPKPEAPAVAAPAPVPAVKPAPASPPVIAAPTPPVATPSPPAAPPTVAAAPGQKMAALAPTPQPPAPAARSPIAATVAFTTQSAELTNASKVELDRVAKTIVDRSPRQIELRAFTGNGDPADRKISLARALIVRTYLIDKGVKSKIEVGALAGDGNERVDILVPNT